MIYAYYTLEDWEFEPVETTQKLYDSWESYYKDTFGPHTTHALINLKISGETYGERKKSLLRISDSLKSRTDRLSRDDMQSIKSWLKVNAKRYGLIKELSYWF